MSKFPLSSLLPPASRGPCLGLLPPGLPSVGSLPCPRSSYLAWTESDSFPRHGALALGPSQAKTGDMRPTHCRVFTEQPLT